MYPQPSGGGTAVGDVTKVLVKKRLVGPNTGYGGTIVIDEGPAGCIQGPLKERKGKVSVGKTKSFEKKEGGNRSKVLT